MMFLIFLLGCLVRLNTQWKGQYSGSQQRWVRQSSQTLVPHIGKKNDFNFTCMWLKREEMIITKRGKETHVMHSWAL